MIEYSHYHDWAWRPLGFLWCLKCKWECNIHLVTVLLSDHPAARLEPLHPTSWTLSTEETMRFRHAGRWWIKSCVQKQCSNLQCIHRESSFRDRPCIEQWLSNLAVGFSPNRTDNDQCHYNYDFHKDIYRLGLYGFQFALYNLWQTVAFDQLSIIYHNKRPL